MPRTHIQRKKSALWNATTKLKFLTKISQTSFAIAIPLNFLEALDIGRDTLLALTIDTLNEQYVIRKVDPADYEIKYRLKNEEVDYTISE